MSAEAARGPIVIAAAALRLAIPLVLNDHIFANVPGLTLLTRPNA